MGSILILIVTLGTDTREQGGRRNAKSTSRDFNMSYDGMMGHKHPKHLSFNGSQ